MHNLRVHEFLRSCFLAAVLGPCQYSLVIDTWSLLIFLWQCLSFSVSLYGSFSEGDAANTDHDGSSKVVGWIVMSLQTAMARMTFEFELFVMTVPQMV